MQDQHPTRGPLTQKIVASDSPPDPLSISPNLPAYGWKSPYAIRSDADGSAFFADY